MTIICASLSQNWIGVSSDSYRTEALDERTLIVVEELLPKIVAVRNSLFYGGLSWCGFSGEGQDLLEWFQGRVDGLNNQTTAQEFAEQITQALNARFAEMSSNWNLPLRDLPWIAVHFAVFEWVDSAQTFIPELFYIHNVRGDYTHSGGEVICQRHSRFHVQPPTTVPMEDHGLPLHRRAVANALNSGNVILFNNPNPRVTVPLRDLVINTLGTVDPENADWHHDVNTQPIVIASEVLSNGALPLSTRIGGTVHSVLFARNGVTVWRPPIPQIPI